MDRSLPGGRKIPQLVAHHILRHLKRYIFFAIMHLELQADKTWQYSATSHIGSYRRFVCLRFSQGKRNNVGPWLEGKTAKNGKTTNPSKPSVSVMATLVSSLLE